MKQMNLFRLAPVLAVALFFSCGEKKDTAAQVVEKTPLVKVQSVKTQMVPQIGTFTATVEPYKQNHIGSSTPNRIKQIFVEVGDHVKAGQKLVEMDAANLAQQKVQLENLSVEYKRAKELLAVGGASQQQVDQLRTQYEAAKAVYTNLTENTTLVSPISGIITARNYDNGDMYAQTPIVTVMQIQPVKVQINVSEQYFTSIKKGMEVKSTFDVYGDEAFNGKVSLIYPTIDPTTRTFTVEISIPNTNLRVRPGMFARVTVDFGSKEHVVVPDQAIVKQSGSGDRFVYVYKDGQVSYNKVELGRRMGSEYELISGVDNNSQVVVAGQTRLSDGKKVEIDK